MLAEATAGGSVYRRSQPGKRKRSDREQWCAGGLNRAKAVLSDGTVLCEAESKSWRYARTKATKLALNMLATPFRKEMLSNPDYQARVLAREEEKIAKRKTEIEARDAAKETLRLEKKAKWKEKVRAKEAANRRKKQDEAKKRKGSQ